MKKKLLIVFCIALCMTVLAWPKENIRTGIGTITKISEGGIHDLVLEFSGNDTVFYINRGYEVFNPGEFRQLYVGKQATVTYSASWNLLDPFNHRARSIETMEIDGKPVYDEKQLQ
jgi:hypothetical protein